MAAQAYQGHVEYSSSKAVGENAEYLAPADRADFDPADYEDQPGAAARRQGYPRH